MALTSLEQSLLVFKALSDPNRLRLYWLLTHVGEATCVCEAMRVLDLPQYETSKHLKQLREAVNAIDPESFKEDKKRCKEICCSVLDE